MADELLLVRKPQPARRRPGGDDERPGIVPFAVDVQTERALRQIGLDDGAVDVLGADFIFSTSSGPSIPIGNPGKFSTSVVIESWPPGSCPMMTSGLRLALAV